MSGEREGLGGAAVDVDVLDGNVLLIQFGKVEESPHGHVGITGTLVLVQIEGAADEEGNVIFHGQVQDVTQGIDLQSVWIFVVGAVDGIVEGEKVFRFLKDKTEEPVLVLPVCLGIFISIYEV